MTSNNGVDQLHETAARGVEAIHLIVTERDDLRLQCDRMQAEIALLRERNNQLDGRLKIASTERDHYMRHAVELVSRLNNIQLLIVSAVEEAGRVAYRPSLVAKLQAQENKVTADEAKQRESLIARLPQNNGDTR
jgi:chromosome segregation ATPase